MNMIVIAVEIEITETNPVEVEQQLVNEDLVEKLLLKMRSGIAEFDFVKRDGTIRHAFGTKLQSLVKDKVVGGEGPAGVISFWDVEKAQWRSVRPHTIVKVY